jgi:glycosyltransferase involved in cell wall biosynthesis
LRRAVEDAAAAGRPFDAIHTAHLPVPRRMPLPYTITIHDLRSLEGEQTPFSRRFVARTVIGDAVRNARCVFTVSETVRTALLERWDLDAERVVVVPNAADHFEPAPRKPAPAAPLLHVGHLEPRKNLELLLRALAEDPELPGLALAGAPKHGEDERLRALACELGVEERVTFLGAFDDTELPKLYAEAACVVLPSQLEGFGIPVLEAQRAHVPLAVARAGALLEVAGEAVPSFETDDAAECAQAIRTALATNSQDLDAAAARAERFTWDRSAETWYEALLRIAQAKP